MKSLIIAAAVMMVAPVLAHAQDLGSDQPSAVPASFQGLDLNNRADAGVMLGRIGDAALEACGASSFSVPQYRDAVRRSDCYHNGVDQAVASLNAPAVTDAYRHRTYVEVGANGQRTPTGF